PARGPPARARGRDRVLEVRTPAALGTGTPGRARAVHARAGPDRDGQARGAQDQLARPLGGLARVQRAVLCAVGSALVGNDLPLCWPGPGTGLDRAVRS